MTPEALRTWWHAGSVVGACLMALSYVLCLRAGHDPEAEFCLLTTVMLAGSVMGWGYYFVLLAFPTVVAVTRVAQQPTASKVMWLVVTLLCLNSLDIQTWGWTSRPVRILVSYLPLYGLVSLSFGFANQLRRESSR